MRGEPICFKSKVLFLLASFGLAGLPLVSQDCATATRPLFEGVLHALKS
jgi:hypothetical protein